MIHFDLGSCIEGEEVSEKIVAPNLCILKHTESRVSLSCGRFGLSVPVFDNISLLIVDGVNAGDGDFFGRKSYLDFVRCNRRLMPMSP
jgi:hypothetical protein